MKVRLFIFLILISLPLLSLCEEKKRVEVEEHFNLSEIFNAPLVDDTGYPIKNVNPERIVSLAPSNTEILFAIGAGDKVAGVTDYCNYPPEVLEKKEKGELASVGGYSTVNIERVLALNPDLVVASYGNGLETIETLRNLGVYVIAFDPRSIEDVMRSIYLIGVATGKENEAKELVKEMAERIKKVKEKVKNEKKVRVAHLIWHDPIWVSGKGTFADDVIEFAGGINVFNFTGWKVVSVEDLIAANPEVIVVNSGSGMGGGRNIIYEWVISDERLKGVEAVKNGRVYVIDSDIISRPSYRLAEAVEIMARFLHPEVWK